MNIKEIEKEIVKLENGRTTYDACMVLAHLYIIRDHYYKENEVMEVETIAKHKENVYNIDGKIQVGKDSKKLVIYGDDEKPEKETVKDVKIDGEIKETEFIKLVRKHGTKKVILTINEYLDHCRNWNPTEYARTIDFLKEKC